MIDLNEASFRREVIEAASTPISIVEFYAPWCPFGLLLGPKLRRLEKRGDGRWLVGRLDVAANQKVAREIGVKYVPGLAIYQGGSQQAIWYGDPPLGAVFAALDALSTVYTPVGGGA